MPVRLRCSNGHEWEFIDGGGSTLPLAAGQCPRCGLPSEQMTLVAAATLPIEVRTLPYSESESRPSAALPRIAGYEILAELGHGGMGVVYRARQLSLKREVALKLPHDSLTASESQLDRFRREAESVAQLRHPNIVQIFDYGVHGGRPYFSMEFLDGGSLANQVANSHVPSRPAAYLVVKLARAIQAAHEAGVIHRDLKPANVLVAADGTPKISDFGLALSFSADNRGPIDGLEGTPSYMAPEQAASQAEKIGPATDVYGLGAILYRLLTGRPPFESQSVAKTLEQVRTSEPTSPRQLQPSVPRDLEAICLKCLRKNPADRYASAAELADDLDRFLRSDAVRARPAPLIETSARFARRRPALITLFTSLAVFAVGAFWYWNAYHRESIELFGDRIYRWGAPVGVDPLTKTEVGHREASLRFHSRAGRVERIEVVGANGELTTRHRFGNSIPSAESWMEIGRPECRFLYEYDRDGRVTTETAADAEGNAVWSFQFTSPTAGYYKDRHGFAAPQSPGGATYIEFEFNPQGRPTIERYCDAHHDPKPDGLGSYGTHNEFDGNGRIIRQMFLDRDRKPVVVYAGIAGIAFGYDERGRLIRGEVLDVNGQRGVATTDVSIMRFENDRWGNLIRYSYYDQGDRPCLWGDEYHGFAIQRDDIGRMTALKLFDRSGAPLLSKSGRFAEIRAEYESGSLPTRQTYWDESGKRCSLKNQFSRIDRKYNLRGDIVEESVFDPDDRAMVGPGKFHKSVQKFAGGDRLEIQMFGVDGKPTADKSGISHQRYRYNDRHQVVRTENVGADGKLTLGSDGIAAWTIQYDSEGRVAEHRFLDADGNPCVNVIWSAGERYRYDADGKRTETVNFDLAGRDVGLRVVVIEVKPGRAAERAGFRIGDVVEKYAGKAILVPNDITEVVNAMSGEANYEVEIRRDGNPMTLQLPSGSPGANFGKRYVLK